VLLTAACAHRRLDSQAEVIVDPGPCFDSAHPDAVAISIVNSTNRPVAFSTFGVSGPPYKLHPRAFDIAPAEAMPIDPEHWEVVLEEFEDSDHEVHLGSGDRAEFHANASEWPTLGYLGKVKLSVRDTRGYLHDSAPVPVCTPGSASNNSFKPNPLHGSA
jgi:hypothetical protein